MELRFGRQAITPWIFAHCYIAEDGTATGWDSTWQRFMQKLVKTTKVKRFTEHDLRAKTGSDVLGAAILQHQLQHSLLIRRLGDAEKVELYVLG
jgi:integrase